MANENEEILRNNNETENDQQTIGGKSPKTTLQARNSGLVTTNGETTDNNRQQTKYPAGSSAGIGDYKNIRATTASAMHSEQQHQQHQQQPVRREENPFSFKHFLNREPTTSCGSSSGSFVINSTTVMGECVANNNESTSTGTTAGAQPSSSYQTSTGARPKVPQSSSSSLIGNSGSGSGGSSSGGGCNGNNATAVQTESSKMKRSPRFSSFDSQASLAEYAATGNGVLGGVCSSSSVGINTRSSPSFRISQSNDDEVTSSSGNATLREDLFAGDYDRQQFVPRRSYSNYDIDVHHPSPRRRVPETTRPNRSFAKPQLNTHPHHSSASSSSAGAPRPPNAEYAAAAALPDFVQDHLTDSWYCSDMNPNSPQNSPIDFVEDITGGAANASAASNNAGNTTDTKCQTLPDFLSDGPIIHSSQRLADVAAGLPSAVNWMNLDSPEDDSPSLQLSRLRLENERLCIELNETRQALSEQTRRANELERALEQTRNIESAYNRTMAQNIGLVEENLDQSKKRTAAAQNQVAKLNLQVKQLTAEVNSLRRENESLRDGDGAVGGSSNTDRPSTSGASRNRPSRSQQISRKLLRAASTAESNLRQLLTGVEDLRQLASDIESSENRFDYDDSYNSSAYPPMSDDFLDGCDDYDEYTGGPAL